MAAPPSKSPWFRSAAVENAYSTDLRKIAREVGRIVGGFDFQEMRQVQQVKDLLGRYAEIVEPWAETRAARMLVQVDQQNQRAWRNAERMSAAFKRELLTTTTGLTMRNMQAEQVTLIKSLPLEAGQRVQRLVLENISGNNVRSTEIAKEIARTGQVTAGRAKMIARTETAKASTLLTMSRALHIGSEGYLWRTSHDSDVRPSHKALDGRFVRWDAPPTTEGMVGHAGCTPNCRCYAEPVIPASLFAYDGDDEDDA